MEIYALYYYLAIFLELWYGIKYILRRLLIHTCFDFTVIIVIVTIITIVIKINIIMKHQRCETSALLNTTELLQYNLRPKEQAIFSYFNQAST